VPHRGRQTAGPALELPRADLAAAMLAAVQDAALIGHAVTIAS
jgi:hypothetical protein